MTVRVLSFCGCPHGETALARVRQALAQLAATAELEEMRMGPGDAAAELGFCGSPTVLVNGRDVEPAPPNQGLACRLYTGGDGAPSLAALSRAMRQTLEDEGDA
ncbi:MAG TPA: hypothetical protein VNF74_06115 [Terriglobales bacterium]|nr:hypothetical protein [Terriglobales bacterium]